MRYFNRFFCFKVCILLSIQVKSNKLKKVPLHPFSMRIRGKIQHRSIQALIQKDYRIEVRMSMWIYEVYYKDYRNKTGVRIAILTIFLSLFLSFNFATPASPVGLPPVKGNEPSILLPVPKNSTEKDYLGLKGNGYFKVSQIKGKALIIQILNVYCPGCQAMATEMSKVYDLIQKDSEVNGQIKLIGIFAGNNAQEVEHFKEGHRIPFPVFPDEDYKIHKALGEVRTPYLIYTLKNSGGGRKIVHVRSKGFTEAEKENLFESMLEIFGWNGKNSIRMRKNLDGVMTDPASLN